MAFSMIPLPQYQNPSDKTVNTLLTMLGASGDIASQLEQAKQVELQNQLAKSQEERVNKLFPEQLKAEQMKNELYPYLTQSQINQNIANTNKLNELLPYQMQEAKLKPEQIRSQINAQNALMDYRKSGAGMSGAGSNALLGFVNQISSDNPQLSPQQINEAASGYLDGSNTFSNGNPLPRLSGLAQQKMALAQGYASPKGLQTQAANADITAKEINDLDISPLKKFAGLKGKVNLFSEKAKMARGLDVSPEARDYIAFQRSAILAMDALRKNFGTSVVPDYVYATMGKLSNPDSEIWNDPQQVQKNWDSLTKWVSKNANLLKKKATQGIGVNLEDLNKTDTLNNNDPLGLR